MSIGADASQKVIDPVIARKKVVDYLESIEDRVTKNSDLGIEAKRGSQAKMRLVGGIMGSEKIFPIVINVRFEYQEQGYLARISVYDDLGLGLKLGMSNKYRLIVENIASGLSNALHGA